MPLVAVSAVPLSVMALRAPTGLTVPNQPPPGPSMAQELAQYIPPPRGVKPHEAHLYNLLVDNPGLADGD